MSEAKFEKLMMIMRRLRKECPWDKEQTHESIKSATLEEAYEAVEAIEEKNFKALKEELGDLLLHIVFHSAIAEENNEFTINDVIDSITEKLIRRHPHIFGDVQADTAQEIEENWEMIKLKEGRNSILQGVPKILPQLQRAYRIQQKVSKVGFDWQNKSDVWEKVEEEIAELKESEELNEPEKIKEEFGDLLFALTNYARFLNIDPEEALKFTNNKFIKRFQFIEAELNKMGKTFKRTNLAEMDELWEKSKRYIE